MNLIRQRLHFVKTQTRGATPKYAFKTRSEREIKKSKGGQRENEAGGDKCSEEIEVMSVCPMGYSLDKAEFGVQMLDG